MICFIFIQEFSGEIFVQQLRLNQIIELVRDNGFVSIDELVSRFRVTPQTIRRDLNKLAEQGKLVRYHGGASLESSTQNTDYHTRIGMSTKGKQRIGERLAELVPDGASLFINIGTTTQACARALLDKRGLQVVTNDIHVASILSASPDCKIIMAGGEVRNSDGGIVGEATVDLINQFQMDLAVIGISGIDADGTLLEYDYRESRVTRAIMDCAKQVLLCADHSKFGRKAMVKLGHLQQVDHLITDSTPDPHFLDLIQNTDIALHSD